MAWKQSVKLEPLNELFDETGIAFEKDEVEGGYVARLGDKRLRRPTLMKCAQAVMKEWVSIA
ncbi:hypothetical protein IQ235_00965 [Oscillatoriales cyanobacterium LEGE 11467]|uniref:Uncharacterized protein n=1 Tax=Zarconia navalis LEGE 11467 TaxID=1828826 RepID=A0A928VSK8_9CYAN|nr:hypothetical protein [Zarconia navalis]MBE9039366.1 hypothetical protein [Zarconia navalis LEGE 11467]